NRALLSAYAPGSTMKPAIAIAGLVENKIDAKKTYECTNYYTCEDLTFQCLSRHGYLNVTSALEKSCNIYFFELGRELGIDKMNKYASLFGLGQKTGIELPETAGMLASVANKEALGETWNAGDTVQAAIGQSDNLFSPIQLVNYCSTIANGGTRYKPFIIKSVLSADLSEVIYETTPEVLNTLSISKNELDIVKQGMRQVLTSTENNAHYIFEDCIVEAAAKTGTSQLKRTTAAGEVVDCTNGFFICYAPYDDAEIAVAVVGENVRTGGGMSSVAVAVYNHYFTQKSKYETMNKNNVLIP
ncbi:MAG: penicillin-binding protein A, partial [Clostridia bacterium]|nr:penicillin-binding protein A [Clostridia bacterium]